MAYDKRRRALALSSEARRLGDTELEEQIKLATETLGDYFYVMPGYKTKLRLERIPQATRGLLASYGFNERQINEFTAYHGDTIDAMNMGAFQSALGRPVYDLQTFSAVDAPGDVKAALKSLLNYEFLEDENKFKRLADSELKTLGGKGLHEDEAGRAFRSGTQRDKIIRASVGDLSRESDRVTGADLGRPFEIVLPDGRSVLHRSALVGGHIKDRNNFPELKDDPVNIRLQNAQFNSRTQGLAKTGETPNELARLAITQMKNAEAAGISQDKARFALEQLKDIGAYGDDPNAVRMLNHLLSYGKDPY